MSGLERTRHSGRESGGHLPAAARHLVAGWWRDHWLMTVVTGVSVAPRVLASLAFRPALFTADSFGYLEEGVHLAPGRANPAGYSILLRVLEPFHSLLLITTLQHLMGITIAVVVYTVLRHRGLPAWGAVLAASPTLFDPRQIMVESAIAPGTLYALLLAAAVAILLTRRGPTTGRAVTAGLLLAWAAVTSVEAVLEMAVVLAVLLIRRAGWRKTLAATAAFAVPVLTYMGVFYANYGNFALTDSSGLFAWSRTMSFANCAVIKPPADLLPLCPGRQPHHPAAPTPAWSLTALLDARTPADYLRAPGVWWQHDSHPGINAANNALATRFALDAIRAQPLAYLRTVGSGVTLTFLATGRAAGAGSLRFTPVPSVPSLDPTQAGELRAYAHLSSDTHPVQPYAYVLYLYQEPVYFTGILFLLAVIAGLAGVIRKWRNRGGPALLPWAVTVIGIVVPAAVGGYSYRDALPVVPLACLAAALAFVRRRPRPLHGTASPPGTHTTADAPAALAELATLVRKVADAVPPPARDQGGLTPGKAPGTPEPITRPDPAG